MVNIVGLGNQQKYHETPKYRFMQLIVCKDLNVTWKTKLRELVSAYQW